ncbi:MAG: MarR family transcriptional regulator [Luminiphilus sp.]|jgi:DNA-binding MarR family transcriptional regulator|nr:MarR family transcriptional regulator [Halieaceae bacterium]MDG2493828.1 MarR family transcriptional regulator [Luminiphilus sp.]
MIKQPPTSSVVYRAFRFMRIISENAQRELDNRLPDTLTSRQFEVLNRLYFVGDQTASQLAAAFNVSAPSMSQMITRLRAVGVIEMSRKSDDARAKLVRMTESGKDILESTVQSLMSGFEPVEEALGAARLQHLLEELEAVQGALSGVASKAKGNGADAEL